MMAELKGLFAFTPPHWQLIVSWWLIFGIGLLAGLAALLAAAYWLINTLTEGREFTTKFFKVAWEMHKRGDL